MPNNQYEWFKGPQNQANKGNNVKANVKTTWKFTRIFLLFSLFFFSMWGCVQTFTNKTSTLVGQGVEITDSQKNISPQVDTIITNSAKDTYMYTFEGSNKNAWLNNYHDKANFDRMTKSYNDKIKGYTLDSALRGGNFIAKLNGKFIDQKDSNIAVATTVFSDKNYSKTLGPAMIKDTVKDYFTNFNYIKGEKWHLKWEQIKDINKIVSKTPIADLYFNNETGIVIKKPSKPNPKLIPLADKKYVDQWFQYGAKNTSNLSPKMPSDGDEVISTITRGNVDMFKTLKLKNYNQVYNLNIIDAILEDYKAKIGKLPTTLASSIKEFKGHYYVPGSKRKKVNPDFLQWQTRLVALKTFEAQTLNIVFGLKANTKFDWNKPLPNQLNDGKDDILFAAPVNYVPIATWGQAWEFGRGSGPFYGIFVYPIAYITNKMINVFPIMAGWESFLAITFVVVLISLITLALSFKGTLQQQRMTELNSKKAIIEAKYEGYKGNKQMENRKRQEVSELYKKEGINPLGSLGTIFITMPFFLAMWRTIGTNQHLKATIWLGINFSLTSYKELFAGNWVYLPLLLLAGTTNILSQLYPRWLTKRRDKNRINVHQKAAMKKGNKTQNIMMFAFTFITLIFAAGLQVYFIIRSIWKIGESTITHKILVRQKKRKIALRK